MDSKISKFLHWMSFAKEQTDAIQSDCQHLWDDRQAMHRIRTGNFDFAIMDTAAMDCFCVLPYSLDMPYAIMSVSWLAWQYR